MRYITKARSKGAFMNDLNTIDGFLNEMCEFISHQEFDLCTDSDDGRVNSSIDEDIVLNMLLKKYAGYIYKMPPRSWCDFKHIPTGEPINQPVCNHRTILVITYLFCIVLVIWISPTLAKQTKQKIKKNGFNGLEKTIKN